MNGTHNTHKQHIMKLTDGQKALLGLVLIVLAYVNYAVPYIALYIAIAK